MQKHHGAIHSQNFRYICDCSSKTSFAVGTPDNPCSLQSRVSDYSGGRGPASLKCQKPEAALVVTKLYEVRAKPEAEDTQLRTGSDTVSPGQSTKKKKMQKGSEKPLKFLEEAEDLVPAGVWLTAHCSSWQSI